MSTLVTIKIKLANPALAQLEKLIENLKNDSWQLVSKNVDEALLTKQDPDFSISSNLDLSSATRHYFQRLLKTHCGYGHIFTPYHRSLELGKCTIDFNEIQGVIKLL